MTPGGGFLEIVKNATPSDTQQQFSFAADGKPYSITGSGGTAPIPLPIGGTHSVAESVPAGWQLDSAVCVLSGGGPTGTADGATVTGVMVESGKVTTCTFADSIETGTLLVKKAVVNDSGGSASASAWSIHVKSGSTEVAGSPQPGSAEGTTYTLVPGTYAVSETGGPSGYALTGFTGDCNGEGMVTVVAGESKTCTLTNDDVAAHLKLVKVVTNDNGGKAVAGDFMLSAAGPTPISGAGGVDKDVSAGTYALSETGPAGYAASAWVCTGGTQSGSSVTLAAGESATCTLTNDDVAPKLHLRKIVVNNDGGTKTVADFRLTADGTGSNDISGSSPVDGGPGLKADTWTLSETSVSGYSASSWVCVGGTQSTNHITLGVGAEATCTITNDDVAPSPSPTPQVVTHPGISVTKSPDEQVITSGSTGSWSIMVTNTGDVTLTNVTVGDALAPGCARTSATVPALAAMAPNASATYTCTLANVTAAFTNVVVATGTPPSGADVTASDTAHVTVTTPFVPPPKPVQHPAISVTKSPSSQTVSAGGTATFTITVTNTGDVALHDVSITDAKSPDCNRDLGTIAPGAKRTYTCTRPGVTTSFLNRVNAVGTSPGGEKVRSTDVAPVKAAPFIPPAVPSIRISKVPKEQTVQAGGKATFKITVTNAGNVTLHAVAVRDPSSPACNRSIGILRPGASKSYSCTRPSVKAPYTNIAQAVGTSPAGKTVRDQDSARVGTVAVKPAFTG